MANYRNEKSTKTATSAKLLLVIAALAIIGITTNYVIKAKDSTNRLLAGANSETSKITPTKSNLPDISTTNNWTRYSNQEGSFTVKYPPKWTPSPSSKLCPSGTFDRSLYLAPDANSNIKCPKILQSQIYISSLVGNQVNRYLFSGKDYLNIRQIPVKVNGISGLKTTANAANTFIERYIVFNGQNTYVAQYIQAASGKSDTKNVQLQFDQMVIQTLTLHN